MDRQQKNRSAPLQVFVSYAEGDEKWRDELLTHLRPLQREGLINAWHRGQIPPGVNQEQEINHHLETFSGILLLISPNFLDSDSCYHREMQRALERKDTNDAYIFPIVVGPCHWQHTPIARLQCLPRNGKPVKAYDNRDVAWEEVVTEIRKAIVESGPPSASTSAPSLPHVWNIPHGSNPFFTGREDELAQLHTQLQQSRIAAIGQIQAISGLGGIGKTELAIQYAYLHKDTYQIVLWALADSTEALNSSYTDIAMQVNLPEKDAKEQKVIVQAVKTWLKNNQHYLLILDNSDNPELLSQFVPSVVGGHLLITTRRSDLSGLNLGITNPITMQRFTDEQGALFLFRRTGLSPSNAHLTQVDLQQQSPVKQLVQALGGLPLALDQAGAYIRALTMSPPEYLQLYQQQNTQLLKEHYNSRYPASTATTWNISFQRVAHDNPAAADLLRLCAFLAPDGIPEAILTKGAEELGPRLAPVVADAHLRNQAIRSLLAYSLINRNQDTGTLTVHRLVQKVLRDSLSPEDQQKWKQRAVQVISTTLPGLEHSDWAECEKWLPHALICDQWITEKENSFPIAPHLLNWIGCYLRERARYHEAKLFLEHAHALNERAHKATSLAEATNLNDLAYLHWNQGEYKEAEKLLLRAQAIHEGRLDYEAFSTDERLQYEESVYNLACIYQTQGNYEEAKKRFQLAPKQADGATSLPAAIDQSNQAELYRRLRRYEEASLLLEHALSIHEKHLGSEHLKTAYVLHKQGLLSYDQGRYNEAEKLFQRIRKIYETCLGYEHPNTAQILHGLAEVYRAQKKYEEAEELFQRALAIMEDKLGSKHSSTAAVLNGLALLYLEQGKYIYVKREGCMKQGGYKQARALFQRALKIRERYLGKEHPDTALILHNLALLYYAQERYKKAEEFFLRALAIWQQQLGGEHPYIVHTLSHLGLLSHAQKRYEKAEEFFLRVLEIQGSRLGQEHPDAVLSLDNLALLYYDQKKYEKAEEFFQRVLEIHEKWLGPEHPETLWMISNYSSLMWIAKRNLETLRFPLYNGEHPLCDQ